MKFLNTLTRFLTSLFISCSIFFIYDIFFVTKYINNKFLDKFVVFISLKENADVEELTKQIKLSLEIVKLKEISYIDKQQVFNFVRAQTELGDILNILNTNPFFDVLRIKIENLNSQEFVKMLNNLKSNPQVKDVVYDKKLLSYLIQLETGLNIYNIFFISMMIYLAVLCILKLLQIYKLELIPVLVFTIIYVLIIFLNNKILYVITRNKEVLNIYSAMSYIIAYIISILHLTYTVKGEKVNV